LLSSLLEATAVIAAVGVVALLGRFLDRKGILAAVIIGYCVYLFGGRLYFLLLLTFFIVGGSATRYRYREKYGNSGRGMRSWTNVVSNGLAAALILVAGYLLGTPQEGVFYAFTGSISAVFSDTMSTEIGMLSKKPPRMVTSLRRASPGTPGAVSILGLAAGFFTGFILAAISLLYCLAGCGLLRPEVLAAVAVTSGFSGSLFDSVFGAVFQSRYRCAVCGRAVEVKQHCGSPTEYLGGSRYVNNELVNLATSFYGAFFGYAIWTYLG
jgi:uncharacterized protein (TIGR00297 family)